MKKIIGIILLSMALCGCSNSENSGNYYIKATSHWNGETWVKSPAVFRNVKWEEDQLIVTCATLEEAIAAKRSLEEQHFTFHHMIDQPTARSDNRYPNGHARGVY